MTKKLKCPYSEEELKEIRNTFKGDKLKCPFCETELEQGIELLRGGHILGCPKCKRNADDIFWLELIDAKIALKEIRQKGLDINATPFALGFIADKALRKMEHKG